METLSGDSFVALATVVAVVLTGIISFFITKWQVAKQGKETVLQLNMQYQHTIRQMQEETQILLKRKRYDLTLDALQKCWGLLVYTTDGENQKSIITYTVEKVMNDGQQTKKYTYYFNKANIDLFIESLRTFFYIDGWGLYLSKELKDELFRYQYIIWGFKLSAKNLPDNIQKINKPEIAKALFDIHKKLIQTIKADIEKIL
jgi:hypothetical protein